MDLDTLIEVIEKYPKLPALLRSGHLAAYHFKYGLDIDTEEYRQLEMDLMLAKIIVKKSNYTRASKETLQYLGERELYFDSIQRLEDTFPGILGMLDSGGVVARHISTIYNLSEEDAQKVIADALTYGLLRCHQYKLFMPQDVKEQLKERNLL